MLMVLVGFVVALMMKIVVVLVMQMDFVEKQVLALFRIGLVIVMRMDCPVVV